jgi:hypothetical protein
MDDRRDCWRARETLIERRRWHRFLFVAAAAYNIG